MRLHAPPGAHLHLPGCAHPPLPHLHRAGAGALRRGLFSLDSLAFPGSTVSLHAPHLSASSSGALWTLPDSGLFDCRAHFLVGHGRLAPLAAAPLRPSAP